MSPSSADRPGPLSPVPDDFDAWFRLLHCPGLGREGARRLLAAYGSPQVVLDQPVPALEPLLGTALARALLEPDGPELDLRESRLQAARTWLAGAGTGPARQVLTLGDPAYPRALWNTADPPLMLYVLGDAGRLSDPAVAIVGSRQATPQGLDTARQLSAALAAEGWTVVSGLALGIDAAAHEGALAAAGAAGTAMARATTVAVVGTGLDRVYPAQHHALAHRIACHGALVSEYAPGTPALASHFPQRNRIIAGLCLGTVVVEAALRSGSLITARLASEAGREVFAVPGSIHAQQSKGCHALLKQGAKLVESAADVLEELQGAAAAAGAIGGAAAASARPGATPGAGAAVSAAGGADRTRPGPQGAGDADDDGDGAVLRRALGTDPVSLDLLAERTGWPAALLTARLLELELADQVARLPGGLFQRRWAG